MKKIMTALFCATALMGATSHVMAADVDALALELQQLDIEEQELALKRKRLALQQKMLQNQTPSSEQQPLLAPQQSVQPSSAPMYPGAPQPYPGYVQAVYGGGYPDYSQPGGYGQGGYVPMESTPLVQQYDPQTNPVVQPTTFHQHVNIAIQHQQPLVISSTEVQPVSTTEVVQSSDQIPQEQITRLGIDTYCERNRAAGKQKHELPSDPRVKAIMTWAEQYNRSLDIRRNDPQLQFDALCLNDWDKRILTKQNIIDLGFNPGHFEPGRRQQPKWFAFSTNPKQGWAP
ncbi:MAG: hypothetical protein K2X98_04870 [Alphaproteobacteria bacterium]|nr:hypothetical protein [Alphaproteobacteria bacterium]